jgi:chaperonin GroES
VYEGVTYIQRRNDMALRPLQDRLLVKRLEEKEQVQGGIIIPDTAKEKPQEAKVLAVGSGRRTEDGKLQPIEVKVGDTIVFGKYAGTEVKIEGDDLLIIREDDVLGVLES